MHACGLARAFVRELVSVRASKALTASDVAAQQDLPVHLSKRRRTTDQLVSLEIVQINGDAHLRLTPVVATVTAAGSRTRRMRPFGGWAGRRR